MKKKRLIVYLVMTFVLLGWGFEYTAAKYALELFDSLTLMFLKCGIGAVVLFVMALHFKCPLRMPLKDIGKVLLCSLSGEIFYFYCEYNAMDYLPVVMITIVLTFVPVVSIAIERLLFRRKANARILVGSFAMIAAIALVIGVSPDILMQGKWIGYVLAFGAVVFWNAFNFLTEDLAKRYHPVALALAQQFYSIVLLAPHALTHMPPADALDTRVIVGVLYLGIVCAGLIFWAYTFSIAMIGPTPVAVFSGFLPVSTAVFGWICLHESLSILQCIGSVIVIAIGLFVIIEKQKLDDRNAGRL